MSNFLLRVEGTSIVDFSGIIEIIYSTLVTAVIGPFRIYHFILMFLVVFLWMRANRNSYTVSHILLSDENKTVGHNTDIGGFENAIKETKYNPLGKKILVLGSGGVAPSIIFALYKMKVSSVTLTNRTRSKAEHLQNLYNSIVVEKNDQNKIKVVDWGEVPEFDMVINATSVGLNKGENLELDFSIAGKNKFFYDVIYNPKETNFLKTGNSLGSKTENGKKMFIFQAAEAFKIWHDIQPVINEEVNKLLDND